MRRLAVSVATTIAVLSLAPQVWAQGAGGDSPMAHHREAPTMLAIAAEGVATGQPDLAMISLGVDTEAETAAAALSANAQSMSALMNAVRRAGVAERDVQTSNVSLNPQYQYGDDAPPRLTGYRASNSVNVRVRNVSNLGRVIDATVGAGGNSVNGVSFSYQDMDAQRDAARRDAMEEAQRLAMLYASAAGMSLGRIVSIGEGVNAPTPVEDNLYIQRVMAVSAPSTPIAAGELETRVIVNVVYVLE